MKFLKIIFSILGSIILLTILIVIMNACYFPLSNIKSYHIDTIYSVLNKKNIDYQILKKSNKIDNQIITTTTPGISFFYVKKDLPFAKYLKNYIFFDNSFWVKYNQFGGIILYDFNTPQLIKYGGIENFIKLIRKNNTFQILVKDTINKKQITAYIEPFIFTDFDYPLINRTPEYLRFKNSFLSANISNSEMINIFSKKGINSFLGPSVDFNYIDSNFEKNINELVENCENDNEIICLKHFCYDKNFGDTHIKKSINNKSKEKLIIEDLYPYYYIEKKIKNNYMIMLGHHNIKNLDSNNIASKSKIIKMFIKEQFPKAITISDEITMQASSNKKIFLNDFSFIKDMQTDIILSHGGNIINYRNLIIQNVEKINLKTKKDKISNILKLKNNFKLIKFSKIENY
jgi:hypothetical protein